MRQHEEAAFRAAYLIVRDEAEARDVAQEAFIRAYWSITRFDVQRPFRPWLLRIVTNVALNSRRASRRRDVMSERYEHHVERMSAADSPELAVEAVEEARRVWQAVGALGPQDQALLYLRYFLDTSEQETAMALGRPIGTVKSRLHRALRRLRRVIEHRYPDLAPGAAGQRATGTKA